MKITVTAGHGGNSPGATYAGMTEAALMAELRDLVAARLRAAGHEVATDGHGDVNEPLPVAVQRIAGAKVAIELHTNAVADPTATGVEVVALPQDKALAQRIAAAIAGTLQLRLRGERGWLPQEKTAHGSLWFVRAGGMVVETFFLSNPGDRSAYLASKDAVAAAIAGAVTA